MQKLKSCVTVFLFLALFQPAKAADNPDSLCLFRFVPDNDMFYVPYGGNDLELARLLEYVRRNKESILGGTLPEGSFQSSYSDNA